MGIKPDCWMLYRGAGCGSATAASYGSGFGTGGRSFGARNWRRGIYAWGFHEVSRAALAGNRAYWWSRSITF